MRRLLTAIALGLACGQPAYADDDDWRERTERQDKPRPDSPKQIDVAGRPLIVTGEVAFELETLRTSSATRHRRVESQLEVEGYYEFTPKVAAFIQTRLGHEREREHPAQTPRIARNYAERGEMWVLVKEPVNAPFDVEIGKLHFEDERRWWWDHELDAVRVIHEADETEMWLAYAGEVAPSRSGSGGIDVEQRRVRRLLLQAAWEWAREHDATVYGLWHRDGSGTGFPGKEVPSDQEDESDARLVWVGANLTGLVPAGGAGGLDYHLDVAHVQGRERLVEYEEASAHTSRVDSVQERRVRGWAVDAGLRWTFAGAPWLRVHAAWAVGSGGNGGGRGDEPGADRSFRQTGLQANEAGFGGMTQHGHYGAALEPELSNLRIVTFGAGLSPSTTSSLDIVFHRYRQRQAATSMRDARIEADLDGRHRDIGRGIDLVGAIEFEDRFQLEVIVSTFRAGRAFGADMGRRWNFGGLSLAVAF